MLSLIGFLIILGPLVVVHEFGHFLFARLFNVKAEAFSIGFGPRLMKKQLGETEFRLSLIPLGGYVKLLGEDREAPLPPEEAKRALHRQAPWKRFFIFFGGPLFNFVFAILIYMAILAIGEPQMASVIGRVIQHSPAEQAGFRSGDRVLSVNQKPVKRYEEIMTVVSENPGNAVYFEVLHPGEQKPVTLTAVPSTQSGFSVYGESSQVGDIEGMMPAPRAAQVGVSNPNSFAAKAGMKTGDLITEINGKPVASWEEFESRFAELPAKAPMKLKYKRGDESLEAEFQKGSSAEQNLDWLGLYSSELFIDKAVPDSPAASAGVKSGDRLIGVGDQTVHTFFELKDAVQKAGEKDGRLVLKWERQGQLMQAEIKPTATSQRDALLKKTTQFTVGVMPMLAFAQPETVIERIWNPITLVVKGTERMVVFTYRNFVSIFKMFTGDVSVATLGGPIMIGKIAGESLERGLIAFLSTMAVLSVGLGVLNILPIPVLDGGHIMLLGLEAIRRKPLTMRQLEIVQQVGLSMILLLMVIVFKNDVMRLPIFQ